MSKSSVTSNTSKVSLAGINKVLPGINVSAPLYFALPEITIKMLALSLSKSLHLSVEKGI